MARRTPRSQERTGSIRIRSGGSVWVKRGGCFDPARLLPRLPERSAHAPEGERGAPHPGGDPRDPERGVAPRGGGDPGGPREGGARVLQLLRSERLRRPRVARDVVRDSKRERGSMTTKAPVSLCMIFRDDPLLEQAVASVRPYVEQVCIVVDDDA